MKADALTYQTFISLEVSGDQYSEITPLSIAWSLTTGEIKSTLISPDEDWEFHERLPEDISFDLLIEQGASCKEIIRELAEDCEDSTIFCDDLEIEEEGLSRVFEAAGTELGYELITWSHSVSESDIESAYSALRWMKEKHNLSGDTPEERVHTMLLAYEALTNKDDDM